MPDLEKVRGGIVCCLMSGPLRPCDACPYEEHPVRGCQAALGRDVTELLDELEKNRRAEEDEGK